MDLKRRKPEATVMLITPTMAKELLATSPHNRRKKQWYIDMLANTMKRGEWRVTSQGVGVNTDGQLRDAHHRLEAVVQSNVPIWSVVVLGLSPEAYEVTDIGMGRSYGDRLNLPDPVAETLRLAGSLLVGHKRPSPDQLRPLIECGLAKAIQALVDFAPTKRRYFSSAPMKLAASVMVMSGADAKFVMGQYRALVTASFDEMTKAAQALYRQLDKTSTQATDSRQVMARGWRVFDKSKSTSVSKIQMPPADVDAAIESIRAALRNLVAEEIKHAQPAPNKGQRELKVQQTLERLFT